MDRQGATQSIDGLLLPLLRAADAAESEERLAQILSEHSEPVIKQVIKSKLHAYIDGAGRSPQNQDAEDIRGEVLVQLLIRLREFTANPDAKAINNFRSYVAVTTYHTCYDHLQFKYPKRNSLKNKIRYVLTHQAGLALWAGAERGLLGGFAAWRDQQAAPLNSARLRQLREDPQSFVQASLPRIDLPRLNPADLLAALFN